MKSTEIIALIDEDITYQKELLEDNYERDKAVHWRISGMEDLKKKLIKEFTWEISLKELVESLKKSKNNPEEITKALIDFKGRMFSNDIDKFTGLDEYEK